MNSRSRSISRILLILYLGAMAWAAMSIDWKHALSTNLFDLIDSDQHLPESVREAQTILQQSLSKEINLIAIPSDGAQLPALKSTFLSQVRAMPCIVEATCTGDMPTQGKWMADLFKHKHLILVPDWWDKVSGGTSSPLSDDELRRIADEAAAALDAFLQTPESTAYEAHVDSDPLLLIPALLRDLSSTSPSDPGIPRVEISARLKEAPSSSEAVQSILRDIGLLRDSLSEAFPGVELLDNGYHRYASESESLIRAEIPRLNLWTAALTLILAFVFLRKPLILLPILSVLVMSAGGAFMITLLLLGQIHVISLVIGSILVGIAVDYAFHILLKREELQTLSFAETLSRIRVPLLASCLSTVFGFLVLLTNPVTAIQQVGWLVGIGLILALSLSALTAMAMDRPGIVRISRRLGFQPPLHHFRRDVPIACILGLACAALFFLRSEERDDIQDLQIPLTQAPLNEQRIRSLSGQQSNRSHHWITIGASITEMVDRQHALLSGIPATDGVRSLGLSSLLPSSESVNRFQRFLQHSGTTFIHYFDSALDQLGYDPESFEAFHAEWNALLSQNGGTPSREELYQGMVASLPYPLTHLANTSGDRFWGMTLLQLPADHAPVEPDGKSFELAPLKTFNEALASYRKQVTFSVMTAALVVAVASFIVFGFKKGIRITGMPFLAVTFALGILALVHPVHSLFHLVGALLGACITLDYAVFVAQGTDRTPPISIRISALTTLASFSVLATSRIPAVADLGLTVVAIVAMGWLLAEYHKLPSK